MTCGQFIRVCKTIKLYVKKNGRGFRFIGLDIPVVNNVDGTFIENEIISEKYSNLRPFILI